MAEDPADNLRRVKQQFDAIGLSAEKLGRDIDIKLGLAAESFFTRMKDGSRRLKNDFRSNIEDMAREFSSGQDRMIVSSNRFSKQFIDAMHSIGAVTVTSTGAMINLKKAMQGVGVVAGSSLGDEVVRALMDAENASSRRTTSSIVQHKAHMLAVEQLVSAYAETGKASDLAFQLIQTHNSDAIIQAKNRYNLEMDAAKTPEHRALAEKKLQESIKSSINLSREQLRIKREEARTPTEKVAAEVAARNVKTTANQILNSKSMVATLLARTKAVQGLAAAERASVAATAGGTGAQISLLTSGQKTMQMLLGIGMRIAGALQAIGGVAGIVMKVANSFGRAAASGAAMTQAISASRVIPISDTFGRIAAGAKLSEMHISKIRGEIGMLGVSGASAINVDALWQSASRAATAIGGISKREDEVIAGLTRVQVLAPLANMSAEEALDTVVRASRVFGSDDPKKFFEKMLGGSRAAGMSMKDFMQSANIEGLGLQWGAEIDQIVDSMAKLVALRMPGAGAAAKSMLTGAFAQISGAGLSTQVALAMGARPQLGFQGAAASVARGNVVLDPVNNLRALMERHGLLKNIEGDPGQRFKASMFLQHFAGADFAKRFFMDRELRGGFLGTGGREFSEKQRQELEKAMQIESNPMAVAARLADEQKDILQRIADTLDGLAQAFLRSRIFGDQNDPTIMTLRGAGAMRSFESTLARGDGGK